MTVAKVPTPYDSDKHCGGKTRAGSKCTRPKGWGTNHVGYGNCKLHFGSTEANNKSAQLEAASTAAKLLSAPVATNPFDSIKQLEAEAAGYVEYFRRQVQALDPNMVYVRPTSILRRPLDEGKDGENPGVEVEEIRELPLDLNIAIKCHRQAMEDLRRISKTAIDTNLADRLVALQENQSQLYADFARSLVLALGLAVDAKTMPVIRKQLEAIDATCEEDE